MWLKIGNYERWVTSKNVLIDLVYSNLAFWWANVVRALEDSWGKWLVKVWDMLLSALRWLNIWDSSFFLNCNSALILLLLVNEMVCWFVTLEQLLLNQWWFVRVDLRLIFTEVDEGSIENVSKAEVNWIDNMVCGLSLFLIKLFVLFYVINISIERIIDVYNLLKSLRQSFLIIGRWCL